MLYVNVLICNYQNFESDLAKSMILFMRFAGLPESVIHQLICQIASLILLAISSHGPYKQ